MVRRRRQAQGDTPLMDSGGETRTMIRSLSVEQNERVSRDDLQRQRDPGAQTAPG